MNIHRPCELATLLLVVTLGVNAASLDLPVCGTGMNVLNNSADENSWSTPGAKIFNKAVEDWSNSDFTAAKEFAKGCLEDACRQSSSWCQTYRELSYDKVAKILDAAPTWAVKARERADAATAEAAAAKQAAQEKKNRENQEQDDAITFHRDALSEIAAMPDVAASAARLDEIENQANQYRSIMLSDEEMEDYVLPLERVIREKRHLVAITTEHAKCAGSMPATGLPKNLYEKTIVGIYAGAIQLETNFHMLFCRTLNKGSSAKFIPPKAGTTRYGIQIRNDVQTMFLTFGRLPELDAWVLVEAVINGDKKEVTAKDALGLLMLLSS